MIHTNEIIAERRKVPSLSFAKQSYYRKGHFLVWYMENMIALLEPLSDIQLLLLFFDKTK